MRLGEIFSDTIRYLFTDSRTVSYIRTDAQLASEVIQSHLRSSNLDYELLKSIIDLQVEIGYTQKPQTASKSHFPALKSHLRTC